MSNYSRIQFEKFYSDLPIPGEASVLYIVNFDENHNNCKTSYIYDENQYILIEVYGGGTGGGVGELTDDSIENSKLKFIEQGWIKGRYTENKGPVQDITISQLKELLGNATTAIHGLMSEVDKAKLDNISESGSLNIVEGTGIKLDKNSETGALSISLNPLPGNNENNIPLNNNILNIGLNAEKLDGYNSNYYLDFSNFKNTPNSLNGYGIIDAANKQHKHDISDLNPGIIPIEKLPSSSINTSGIVKLNNTLTSESISEAATSNVVKQINDKFSNYVPISMLGDPEGVATLHKGKIPASQLPSFIDEIVEYPSKNSFPLTGEQGKIYYDLGTQKSYRWGGTEYVEVSSPDKSNVSGKLEFARKIKITGDAEYEVLFDGSSDVSNDLVLKDTGIIPGIYKSITVDSKGRITQGTNPTTLSDYGIIDAAEKQHTHSFNNITDKPTTLEGYGITNLVLTNHKHSFSSITNLPDSLTGYGITEDDQIIRDALAKYTIGTELKKVFDIQNKIYYSVASYNNKLPNQKGILKLNLPYDWSFTMIQLKLTGFNYSSNSHWETLISGYDYKSGNSWVNSAVTLIGDAPFKSVKLGYDGNTPCILFGNLETIWSYGSIILERVLVSYSGAELQWNKNWTFNFINNDSNIILTAIPQINKGFDADTVNSSGLGEFGIYLNTPNSIDLINKNGYYYLGEFSSTKPKNVNLAYLHHIQADSNFGCQYLTDAKTGKTYSRIKNLKTWSEWKILLNTDHISTDKLDGLFNLTISKDDPLISKKYENSFKSTALTSIEYGDAVYIDSNFKINKVDLTNSNTINKCIGLALNSAQSNEEIYVKTKGEFLIPTFYFSSDKVYLSIDGYTQIKPTTNTLCLGYAIQNNKIYIDISDITII